MASRSDAELVAIVTTDRNKYQQLAIEAAEHEIESRNISAERRDALQLKNLEHMQLVYDLDTRKVSSSVRFANFIVDIIVIFICNSIFAVLMSLTGIDTSAGTGVPLLFFLIVFCGYYVVMESEWQQTLGKMVTGTKVVTALDERPTLGDIVARTLCRLIPFDRVSFLFTQNGFHDSISKTMVVRK